MAAKKSTSKPKIQYGAGRTVKRGKTAPTRLGLIDPAEAREVQVNFRMTAKEVALVEEAFAAQGKGESFAVFRSTLMLEAIAARSRGIAILESDGAATAREVQGLASGIRDDLEPKVDQVLGLQKRVGAAAIVHQKEIRAVQANVDQLGAHVEKLYSHMDAMSAAVSALGDRLDRGLTLVAAVLERVDHEGRRTLAPERNFPAPRAQRVS